MLMVFSAFYRILESVHHHIHHSTDVKKEQRFEKVRIELMLNKSWREKVPLTSLLLYVRIVFIRYPLVLLKFICL